MFSNLVVAYLFLGGAGAGLCVVMAACGLAVPRGAVSVPEAARAYQRLFAPGFALAAVLLALGVVCLLADLGGPARAVLLFALPHPTLLTFGAFVLAGAFATSCVLAWMWACATQALAGAALRVLYVTATVLGACVAVYTGLLLAGMQAVPAWHTLWLPALFACSAGSCGVACAVGLGVFTGAAGAFRMLVARLLRADVVLIAAEAVCAVGLLMGMAAQPYSAGAAAAQNLLAGSYALPFVAGFGALGLAVPLALEAGGLLVGAQRGRADNQGRAVWLLVLTACVLVGAVCMRYALVGAGAHPAVWAEVL